VLIAERYQGLRYDLFNQRCLYDRKALAGETRVALRRRRIATHQRCGERPVARLTAAVVRNLQNSVHNSVNRSAERSETARFYAVSKLLWAPAQRKRATMSYFANVFFKFFYGRLILRPWLTEVRESFTRGGP